MKKRLSVVLTAALALCALAGVSSASAATEFGSSCAANEAEAVYGAISVSHGASSPLPVAAPISGVITEWKLTTAFTEVTPEFAAEANSFLGQQMQVYRPAGEHLYTLVGESTSGSINFNGVNVYPARIPVQAGDVLGLGGSSFNMVCEVTDPKDSAVEFIGGPVVGSTVKTSEPNTEFQVPVSARIEPDVDGDGYGDETQDQCPQSAAYQTACPVVTISSLPTAAKNAVTLRVTTSLSAPVGVTATVPLGKGKTATLTAAAQTVAPGTLAAFTLTLTPEVTKALKALPTKKSLTMSIAASATNVTGSPSTSATTVTLPGQAKAKPKPKHHKKHKKSKAK